MCQIYKDYLSRLNVNIRISYNSYYLQTVYRKTRYKQMRIMLDTNILISAFVFNSKTLNKVIETILLEHRLILSSFVIDELKRVVSRKFPNKLRELDEFLTVLPYELVYTPEVMDEGLFEIRDKMDYPVLYTAIIEGVDVLVTGDKDFSDVNVEKPEILTPGEFFGKYVSMLE